MDRTAAGAAALFRSDGEVTACERYGQGHINATYRVRTSAGGDYILQRINERIFTDVPALMRNIELVTSFLRRKDPDPRHTMRLVEAAAGGVYVHTESGYWRMYDFVQDSLCLQQPETPEDFYQSAVAFGSFQAQLADFPAAELTEIIPHFHDTPDRYRQLHEAIDADRAGRLESVRPELEFALAREAGAGALTRQLAEGVLPLRVTHNDTKLNNVLLDAHTRLPLCVIDLDTVMPGLAAYDFGDSIRFGASTAAEDERDLSRVELSMDRYETYARGFLGACGSGMSREERLSLPEGARLMTLECGIRFLADYLNGDVYFHTTREGQNLDRCRTQLKLVADMERRRSRMDEIILSV